MLYVLQIKNRMEILVLDIMFKHKIKELIVLNEFNSSAARRAFVSNQYANNNVQLLKP